LRARDVFTGIADPTRRDILDLLLANEVLAAGDIANHFSSASRPGISRHLRVLRECGLVTVARAGKTQIKANRKMPSPQLTRRTRYEIA